MATAQDVIDDRVRYILADTVEGAAERWGDDVLLTWLNDAGWLVEQLRPEIFLTDAYTLGTWTEVTALSGTIYPPTNTDRWLAAFSDYVCARALAMDAQDERDLNRARTHFQQFVLKAGLPLRGAAQAELGPGRRL